MSGIAAVFHFDGSNIEPETIERLTEEIAYRGPDGITHWHEGPASIGYCALQTTAESMTADQPLCSDNGNLVLVLDGYLHNHVELRDELRAKGSIFRSISDAEVILRAYEYWAKDCVRRLEGEFAFVVWDKRQRSAFCARDHAGLRPLHYHWDRQRLTVASDLGAILVAPGVPQKINESMMAQVASNEWITRGETIWKGVMRLHPASWAMFSRDGVSSSKYWSPPTEVTIRYKRDEDYFEHYRTLLEDCVRRSSRSHLPIASDVSGGLDSSAIFAVAEHLRQKGQLLAPSVKGYTYKFEPGSQAYETNYAADVGAHVGLAVQEVSPFFPDLDWFIQSGRRNRDTAPYPNTSMAISIGETLLREGCRVSLNGEGGDEWLGGRGYYFAEQMAERDWPAMFRSLREDCSDLGLKSTVYRLARFGIVPLVSQSWLASIRKIFSPKGPNEFHSAFWLQPNIDRLLTDCRNSIDRSHISAVANRARRSMFETLQHPFLELFRDQFARQSARLSIEGRMPMYARPFIEFAFSTPERIRLRGNVRKYVHTQAIRDLLPPSVIDRRTKADFSVAFERLLEKAYISIMTSFPDFKRKFLNPCGITTLRDYNREWPWQERPIWELWGAFACAVPYESTLGIVPGEVGDV